jgi:hypothetical protein
MRIPQLCPDCSIYGLSDSKQWRARRILAMQRGTACRDGDYSIVSAGLGPLRAVLKQLTDEARGP